MRLTTWRLSPPILSMRLQCGLVSPRPQGLRLMEKLVYPIREPGLAALTSEEAKIIMGTRVAHLATADAVGILNLVPVCFYYDGQRFYTVIDQKPKRTSMLQLKRVRNILSNSNVALLIDHYEEEWSRLWYVLAIGLAHLVYTEVERQPAMMGLQQKYLQYRSMKIDKNPLICINPSKIIRWGRLA